MKNLILLPFLLLVLLATACGNDDNDGATPSEDGTISIGGESITLRAAFKESYGPNDADETSYNVDLTLTSDPNLLASGMTWVFFELHTSIEEDFDEITYTFDEDAYEVGGMTDAYALSNTSLVDFSNFGPQNQARAGTVTISRSGNTVDVDFDLTMGDDSRVTGNYRGPLTTL